MTKIIDFHAHIYPDKIADKAAENVGKFYGLPMNHGGSVMELLKSGKLAGVNGYVVQSVATAPAQVESINNFIAQTCRDHPEMVGFGTLHPDMENPQAEIDRCMALGLRGIKLHPDCQKFNMDDERMMPVYAALEGRLPILMHCGDYRYSYSHPKRLARILDAYPRLDVVAAHFGGWSIFDLAAEYLKGRRCWLDISSSMAFLGAQRSRELIRLYGADRMLFGTDFPMWDHVTELGRLRALGLTDTEMEKILYHNACDVLKTEL